MTPLRLFLLSISLSVGLLTASGQVVITELMQSNIDCVMDDLNEYPDSWVELYNAGNSTEQLSRYSIGLTDDASAAWHLPSRSLQPGAYLLVYCDKEAKGLHTNFRLESGKGGAVYLFKDGSLADAVTAIPKQPTPNVAYGRPQGAAKDVWGYLALPTPQSSNPSSVAAGVLGEPVFSLEAGVMSKGPGHTFSLSLPDDAPAGSVVRYTTDGSEPTTKSTLYTSSVAFTKATVLRAKVFCDGWISPRSTVHSYLVMDHQPSLPIVSIVTDKKNLTDSKIGILVDGNYNSQTKNYQYDWRRPLNIEIFESDGTTCSVNQLCEGRVMGAASRGQALKSMALYAHKRFGAKRFDYEFFPDQRPGETNYKSFLLRNAGNDFDYLYMRDAIIQRTMASHTDLDWQAWRPAVVFVNGEYKGILNLRDRSNDDNIFTYYNELEDIDIVKNNWELQHGTWDHYNAFKTFYTEHGHTWDEYAQWIDLDEYINVMAMNLYFGNVDFPGNNIVMWRPRTEDGRWRIIAKDTDYALGIYDMSNTYNMVQWINNADHDGSHNWANQWDHTRLFRRLMEDADFQRIFTDRMAIYMGDFLNERGTRAVWDAMYELIKDEYPIHRELYNRWWPVYSQELSKARKWLTGRTEQHYNHLANYYAPGTLQPMTVNLGSNPQERLGYRIMFNGVELSEGTFSGKFYRGREIVLEGRPATGDDYERYALMKLRSEGKLPDYEASDVTPRVVTGWKVVVITNSGPLPAEEYTGSTLRITMPSCVCLQVMPVTEEYDAAGVVELLATSQPQTSSTSIYDLQGRPSSGARPAGIYLKRDANGNARKVVLK